MDNVVQSAIANLVKMNEYQSMTYDLRNSHKTASVVAPGDGSVESTLASLFGEEFRKVVSSTSSTDDFYGRLRFAYETFRQKSEIFFRNGKVGRRVALALFYVLAIIEHLSRMPIYIGCNGYYRDKWKVNKLHCQAQDSISTRFHNFLQALHHTYSGDAIQP